jgi:thioesterase domain-containing protein
MDLIRQLDPHRTYYGLQAQGLDGKQPPLTRVEDMAQCYSTLVHNLQPEGPYWLAGWSMGGVIAFEMAQQLKAQHQPVGLLALIDAYLPDNQAMPQTDEIWFLANLVLSSGLPLNVNLSLEVVGLLQARFAPLLPHERLSAMWSYLKQAKVALPDMDLSQVHHLFDIFQSNTQALQCYTPRDYSSPIVLFQAGEHLLAMQREAVDSGWRTLVQGELAVHTLPGNHYSLLRKPAVEILAEQLRSYLQG